MVVLVGGSCYFSAQGNPSSLVIDGAAQERRLKVISCLEKTLKYGAEKGHKLDVARAILALSVEDESSQKVSALTNVMALLYPRDKIDAQVNLLEGLSLSDLSSGVCKDLSEILRVSWLSVARNTCLGFMMTGMGALGTYALLQPCWNDRSEQDFTQDQECTPFHRTGLMASISALSAGVLSLCCIPCFYKEKQSCEQAYMQLCSRAHTLLEVHIDIDNDLCVEVAGVTQ